jgi:hypothetical protein
VNSLYRIFFFSLGSICLLIVPLFWLALAFEYTALENFVLRLTKTEFVGYPIPEILGASFDQGFEQNSQRIKMAFSILLGCYAVLLISVSYLDRVGNMLRILSAGVLLPLFSSLVYFWITFNMDDHVISKAEKSELFKFTVFALFLSVFLFWFSFRKRSAKKKVVKTESRKPVVSEPTMDREVRTELGANEDSSLVPGNGTVPESNDVKEQAPEADANEGLVQPDATVPLEAQITPETEGEPDVQEAESNETIDDNSGEHIPVEETDTDEEPKDTSSNEPVEKEQDLEINIAISSDAESDELKPVETSVGEIDKQDSAEEKK